MWSRVSILLLLAGATAQAAGTDTDFLVPSLKAGAQFSNIFSIAASIKAEGFDELVGRNSGSGDYTFVKATPDHALTFDAHFAYEGSTAEHAEIVMSDGGATQCWKGECRQYTDASGLLYNRWLWGNVPAVLKTGLVWKVQIPQAWELGPAGSQTVTVVHVDASDGTVTLKREGNATGAFAGEVAQVTLLKDGKKVQFNVSPGSAHWRGFTTFRHGIVISDELLVTRLDKLQSEQTGVVNATRRRYMLLNAAPYPTLQ